MFSAEEAYVKQQFKNYYTYTKIPLPDRFTRREFAVFMFNGMGMTRHMRFLSEASIHDWLAKCAPRHLYNSTAYYRNPSAPGSMENKGWLGADLIFDLDADHLRNAKEMTFEEQLAKVKEMTKKLVYEFLIPDFGFAEEHIHLNFSGGRGYHVHITDPKVLSMEASDRQQVVDYITATGLKKDWAFVTEKVHQRYKDKVNTKEFHSLYRESAPGWKGKLRKGMAGLIDTLNTMNDREAAEFIENLRKESGMERAIGPIRAGHLYDIVVDSGKKLKEKGNLPQYMNKCQIEDFCELIIAYSKVNVAGDIDEPVTKDVKRLIRTPYSLHGKTGLLVKPLTFNEFESFNPLYDAVVFDDQPVRVNVVKDFSINMLQQHDLKAGENIVTMYLAVFLLGSGRAKILTA